MRALPSIVLVAGLLATLAACTPAAPELANCDASPSGAASNAVKVSGEFGAKPEIEVGTVSSPAATERTIVIPSDGEPAQAGTTVIVDYTLFNAATGAEVDATPYDGNPLAFTLDETVIIGIVETIQCTQVGSRVVGVIPPASAFGEAGSEQLGIGPADDLIFVVDVVSIEAPADPPLARADGEDQPATDGFPTVVLDADGRPTVTIPDVAPPTELGIAVLKQGSGATVEPGADVTVHYLGINWNTGVIFDESWARGEPATFNTAGVIAGFTAALEGQQVGSQVIVIIPPDQGYGEAGSGPDIGGTDTLVFVIDILGIA
ncbi:MAG: FKBP-type peptidyl-prolyl cis-trans isomerase [Salinibacterium sp.]|nr:FKBP-type peptidyl-prolyl cis-trans isomerase [Salinibacterium sp.]